MSIKKYIANQFRKPTGLGGRISTFIMNKMNQIQYDAVKQNLSLKPNSNILDIGFGNGYLLEILSNISSSTFYGIDISEDMLKQATKRNSNSIMNNKMQLQIADVKVLPYDENFFDEIYTVNTIYFWDNLDKALSEIKRVLKPNGIFLNVMYTKEYLNKIRYTQHGYAKYTLKELKDAVKRNGLKMIEVIETKKNVSNCCVIKK